MTEAIEAKPKRKGRGPGKKPALVCTSIRLSREVMDYFDQHHPHDKQKRMREILADFVSQQPKLKEPENGTTPSIYE